MKRLAPTLLCLCFFSLFCQPARAKDKDKVIVAYVTAGTRQSPDPFCMTHINYAFGHVNKSFDGVVVARPERLRALVGLKAKNPQLKILLSIGGWGSGRFSEMAAEAGNRLRFARDCARIAQEFALDGIDIDWEYPTSAAAGISAHPSDTENFTLLMRDLRKALGRRKLLTLATVHSAKYIDLKAIDKYVDLVNVMAYDMAPKGKHHAPLYASDNTCAHTMAAAIDAHLVAGVPPSKLVVGLPFYGRGLYEFADYMSYGQILARTDVNFCWDEQAQAPYLTDKDGRFLMGYDTPQSIALKCAYLNGLHLRGAMYWEYATDNPQGDLRQAVYQGIMGKPVPTRENPL